MSAGVGLRMRRTTSVFGLLVALVISALFALAPASARAATTLTYRVSAYCDGQVFDSPQAAADCIIAKLRQNDNLHPVPWKFPLVDGSCETPTVTTSAQCSGHRNALCDTPGTYEAGGCGPFPPYTDNQIWTATITAQEGVVCTAGTHSTLNVTSGWARTSTVGASDIVVDLWTTAGAIRADRCDGQCVVSFSALKSCYRSQIPAANGLHRLSCDLDVVTTGSKCSTASSDASPNTPPAPCPGYVGEVNGKKVCVGNAGTPLPQTPKPSGTPPDTMGNPAAGQAPTSGPGSGSGGKGRTPVSGDGGNGGGGSNASEPGGGSDGNGQTTTPGSGTGGSGGTGEDPQKVEVCGLPGKAPCKIDETGTPDGHGALDAANASLDSAKTASVGAVTSAGSQVTGLAWLWGFALPSGTCTVLTTQTRLGVLSIDVCNSPAVALWRSVAGYMLFILGALYIWRSATSSTPGGK